MLYQAARRMSDEAPVVEGGGDGEDGLSLRLMPSELRP